MLYVEDIEALKFWLSPARVMLDGQALSRLSSLRGCPRTARESSWHSLEELPYTFEHPTLAVPAPEFRVQRKRFDYHVWTHEIPRGSFCRVSDDVAVASPALAIAQSAKRFREEHLAQAVCSLAGSYITPPGKRAGLIDGLEPIVTIEELWDMTESLKGICNCEHLQSALKYAAENSASPGETKVLLACAMPRQKGGLHTGGWEMNPEIRLPYRLQRYLDKKKVYPDLLSREHNLVVEYDSDERHSTEAERASDEKRAVALNLMGYTVISVRAHHLRSASAFEGPAQEILKAFKKTRVESNAKQLASRGRLLASLRSNPLLP